MRDQGCQVECPYCASIHPELKNTDKCPECHGKNSFFRPMRMMDRYTSQMDLIENIFRPYFSKSKTELRAFFLNLLTEIDVYNFDLKEAIIAYFRSTLDT
jgi:hypothetical protein